MTTIRNTNRTKNYFGIFRMETILKTDSVLIYNEDNEFVTSMKLTGRLKEMLGKEQSIYIKVYVLEDGTLDIIKKVNDKIIN